MFNDISIKLVETDEDLVDALMLKYQDDIENMDGVFDIPFPNIETADIKLQKNNFFIAKKGNIPIGYASGIVAPHSPNIYWSEGIYVIPEFRNNGIGFALKKAQVEFARQSGFEHLCSKVLKTNIPSIHVQEKLGFTFVPRGDFYTVTMYLQNKPV